MLCAQNTLSHSFFSCAQSVRKRYQVVIHHSLSKPCAFSKTVHTTRNMSCITPELTSTFSLCTRIPSYSFGMTYLSFVDFPFKRDKSLPRSTTSEYRQSDVDDEQIRALLASPLYLQEREASADRSQVYHYVRENLVSMSSSSQVRKSTEKPVELFSSKRKSRHFQTEVSSSEQQQVQGNNEPLFRFSDPKEATRSFLEEH